MRKPVTTFNAASAFRGVLLYKINVVSLAEGAYRVELVIDDVKMTNRLVVSRKVLFCFYIVADRIPATSFYNFFWVASSNNSLIIVASHT